MHQSWLTAVVVGVLAMAVSGPAFAADHSEAPTSASDQPADIADLYAWHEGSTLYAAITVSGLATPSADPNGNYDGDVLYTLHLDQDGDNASDVDVRIRFGQNNAGAWGVQAENLPGTSGPLSGATGSVIQGPGVTALYAGLRDDPFFFDLQGFTETLTTGTLAFDNTRDSVAGLNATAIVLAMDLAAATGSGTTVNLWATTARK